MMFLKYRILEPDEQVSGIMEEFSFVDTIGELENSLYSNEGQSFFIPANSVDMYAEIATFRNRMDMVARVHTKYKTVDRKVRPVAEPLPADSIDRLKRVKQEPMLRDPRKIGHVFTESSQGKLRIGGGDFLNRAEESQFRSMLSQHGKAFAFSPSEIGCVDPQLVEPMIIFTVPHMPWNLKPIPVPRAHIPKLIELLKEKVQMGILEPSNAPYSNRWFTVPKKNGSLRFIQDLQPVNKVTIRNSGVGPVVDSFAESFAGRAIYSMVDLYSGYDQFQLAMDSRDITTMRTPIGLVRMCTLPQGATNSVAHMMNGMNKVLRDHIPHRTMPFLDDIPIKGCLEEEKDEEIGLDGCRKFVSDHIADCEDILKNLEEAHLTISGEKSSFGRSEVRIVGHLCGPYGRKPDPAKVDGINAMEDICKSTSEVRRFLGACVFYHIWIPHFAHIVDPLYKLLQKGQRFTWEEEHTLAMKKIKILLSSAPALRRPIYEQGRPIFVTVDASPAGIGWVINQEDETGDRYAIRFGAKILHDQQRRYAQIKRELWGIVSAIKADKDYLIGSEVVIETDCLPILGMISGCSSTDISMLRWIAYIKTFNPEIRHIKGKNNAMADMLSRARTILEPSSLEEEDDFDNGFFCNEIGVQVPEFREEEYEGELLQIGKFLQAQEGSPDWTPKDFRLFRKKAYRFFLKDGYLWKLAKKVKDPPTRAIGLQVQKEKIISDFHDSHWAGHKGVVNTFSKIKDRYWWKGMYADIQRYVESCIECQMYSDYRVRDELHPTCSPVLHYKWMVDIVHMPSGRNQMKYLVLAREDLSNQVEGRPLRNKSASTILKFLLEDVICRYGNVGQIVTDRGELDSDEARMFFQRFGIRLTLTTAYNPEGNGKVERGHGPIVKALVKACDGRISIWPDMLPYALWADRCTHNSVTGFMPSELLFGQKPIMPTERMIPTWGVLPWEDQMEREDLLAIRIRQLENRPEDIAEAARRQREVRLKNKDRFDKRHRLRNIPIEKGDWVLVFDSSLEHQHKSIRKFSHRWFGPYRVIEVRQNGTYILSEFDGTLLRIPIAGKRIKLFKQRASLVPDILQDEGSMEANSNWEEDIEEEEVHEVGAASIKLEAVMKISSHDTGLEKIVNEKSALRSEGVKMSLVSTELNEDDWHASYVRINGRKILLEFSPLGTYRRMCKLGGGACRKGIRPTGATMIPQLQPRISTWFGDPTLLGDPPDSTFWS